MRTVGRAYGCVEVGALVLVLLVAPVVAIVAFTTGDRGTGWAAVGLFACALVYGAVIAVGWMRGTE